MIFLEFIESIIFQIFASIIFISGIMVIRGINPVHSILFLILIFCNVAALLILLEADFLGIIFLIIYVGAITVLFLFIVMMLNIKITVLDQVLLNNLSFGYLPFTSLIGIIFIFEIFLILENDLIPLIPNFDYFFYGITINWAHLIYNFEIIETLGQVIYTFYFNFFLLAGLILLVAMIGAIVLTLSNQKNVKRQQIFQQISRNSNNATFLIS